jgi:hypothetical protein
MSGCAKESKESKETKEKDDSGYGALLAGLRTARAVDSFALPNQLAPRVFVSVQIEPREPLSAVQRENSARYWQALRIYGLVDSWKQEESGFTSVILSVVDKQEAESLAKQDPSAALGTVHVGDL